MYEVAYEQGFAIGAFNINGIESVQAITEAAAEEHSPVILQACEKALAQFKPRYLMRVIEAALETNDIPLALNLDHGETFEICKTAVDVGYTSVMIDGSRFSLDENIAITRRVIEYARERGVAVEAELGKIAGNEGVVLVGPKEASFTDPDEAVRFVEATRCDSLAVAIGTAHGANKFEGEPKLDYERLATIKAKLPGLPLVLHGASSVPQEFVAMANQYGAKFAGARGVPEEMVTRAAKSGVCKVNVNTDLCIAMAANVRKYFAEHPTATEPRDYMAAGRDAIKALVKRKLNAFGSAGKSAAIAKKISEKRAAGALR
jgi:fructose-bisphosphate aldolase class II